MNLEGGKIRENALSSMRSSQSMVCSLAQEKKEGETKQEQICCENK